MNPIEDAASGYNRRDFLKGGSAAALMTMLGGVELVAADAAPPAGGTAPTRKINVAVIGLGSWGREIVTALSQEPHSHVAAICDNYPAFVRRTATLAPDAKPVEDYKAILADKTIPAVVISTPTQKHKEIAIEALAAGKHVYCEAPLANTVEDAKAIALAAKATSKQIFQAGLQRRSDPQLHFLRPFLRSGALGKNVLVRGQFHKKQSWRTSASTPAREKELNWRLDKSISTGLMGEIGIHQTDEATWLLSALPTAVSGWGSIQFWDDGRDVPDTVQTVFEYPGGVRLVYDATLANSFDGDHGIYYGSDAAVMIRDSKAWMFKEVDSALLGWEVYATKQVFYKDTGISLVAGKSKAVPTGANPTSGATVDPKVTESTLFSALSTFMANVTDLVIAEEDYISTYGSDDPKTMLESLAEARKAALQARKAASYLEGFQATVLAIKANEAVMGQKRIELKPEWFDLG